jgi:hypothetical protein
MAQGGSCTGFGCKSTAQVGVVTCIGPQHLQSNNTIQARVISAQNHPHTTAANFLFHFVPAVYQFTQHGCAYTLLCPDLAMVARIISLS